MTFLEESLLKQAHDEAQRREKETEDESEVERIAELRRKGRGKGNCRIVRICCTYSDIEICGKYISKYFISVTEGLKILKNNEALLAKSQQLFDNKEY